MCGIYSFAHLSKYLGANEVEKVANHETNQQSIGLWTQSLCLCQRPWCFPEVGGWPVFCPTYSTLPAKPVVKHLFFKLPLPPPPAGCLSGLQQFFSINFSSFSKSDLTFDCRSLMNIILRAIWFINYIPAKPVVESILGSRRCISNFPPFQAAACQSRPLLPGSQSSLVARSRKTQLARILVTLLCLPAPHQPHHCFPISFRSHKI